MLALLEHFTAVIIQYGAFDAVYNVCLIFSFMLIVILPSLLFIWCGLLSSLDFFWNHKPTGISDCSKLCVGLPLFFNYDVDVTVLIRNSTAVNILLNTVTWPCIVSVLLRVFSQ